jgi:aminoglycoside 6'-N-acetyltransferase
MPEPISLRHAVPADAALLYRWDRAPHVIAGRGDDDGFYRWDVELSRRPDWRELLIAEQAGRQVGFVQIIDPAREESHYWGAIEPNLRAIDIWIGAAADLGRGYGTAIMTLAIARCFADPAVAAVLVDPPAANARVLRFYERLGFASVGRRVLGGDECCVYRLGRPASKS